MSLLRFAIALALSLLHTAASSAAEETLRAGVFEPARAAPALELPGSDGAAVTLERFRGKVVVLAFGFTSCTNVCPVTLAVLAKARRALGGAAADVQVVYVTVDPERDDARRMRDYLKAYDATFVGATGSEEQLAEVRSRYGVAAQRVALAQGYAVNHSSFTYLIDRAGKLRALMPFGQSADDYAHDLRILLGS